MVKKTLRLAVPPTLCALARHLSGTCISSWTHKSPCVSLQVHLLFTCSSLIHMSFNCGSLGQQSFQWMLHNWLIRAWRPAATKHWVKFLFSAKRLYPCCLAARVLDLTTPVRIRCWPLWNTWEALSGRKLTWVPALKAMYVLISKLRLWIACTKWLGSNM